MAALVGLFAPSAARASADLHLVLPSIEVGDALSGFDLDIRSGSVSSVIPCPRGWRIEIDNDPSWNAHVSAHALVGAAPLEVPSIERMLRVKQIPPEDAANVSPTASVSGTVTLVDRHGARTILRLRGVRLAP